MQIPDYVFGQTGVVRCEPEWSWSPPPLRDHDLWFVFSGRGTMRLRGVEHPVYPGCMFLLAPGDEPVGQHDPRRPLGVCFLHFSASNGRRARRTIPGLSALPTHAVLDDVAHHESVLRRVVQCVHADDDDHRLQAALGLHGTLLAFRAASKDESQPGDQRELREQFLNIARSIEENPGRTSTVAHLAEQAGYDPDYFTRLFTSIVGIAPKEFCVRARLRRARQLLRETRLPLKAIASALGYADEFFLSRQFKQHVGMPPAQWRRSQRS